MKFKKQFTILLALVMIFSSIVNVAAYSWQYGEEIPRSVKIKEAESNKDYKEEMVKYVFTIGLSTYQKVSGSNVETRQMDTAPYIKNGRTMLPLRYVSDAISASVYWNNQTRTASFTKESLEAKIQIDGNKIVMSNGTIHTMDTKPDNVKGRILVPITNVANVYSLTNGNSTDGVDNDIEWDGSNRTVTIYLKKYSYIGKKTSEITSDTSSPARRNNGYERDYRRSSRYRYDDYSRRYDEYDYWNTYWNIYWRDFCNHNCNPNTSCTNECKCKDNCGKNCKCNEKEIKTDAEKYPVVKPQKVEVGNRLAITLEEKAKVEAEIKKVNPEAKIIEVKDNGDAVITYPDNSTNTINGEDTIIEKVKTDADKYNITTNPLIKSIGEAITEEEIISRVITDYPKDAEKQPKISVKDLAILPNGEIEGTTPVIVVVEYPDGSTEEAEVNVTIGSLPADKTDAEKYPVVKPEKVEVENRLALTPEEKAKVEEEIKKTNPEAKAVEVKDNGDAIIIYPDDSTNTISGEDTITERVKTDAEKYNITTESLMKNIGETITEDEIISKVKIDYMQDSEEQPKISVKDPEAIPNTDTELTTSIEVIVEYPDGSKEEVLVEIRVGNFTDAEKYPVVKPEKTEVEDRAELTPVEKVKVEKEVKKVNLEAKTIEVKDNGDVIITYQDDSANKISGNDTVAEKISTDAEKNPVMDPAITEVENKEHLTPEEKAKVEEEIKKVNPEAETIVVADDGTVTLTYPDGSTNEITGEKTVVQKEKTEAEIYDVTTKPVNKKYGEAVTEKEIINNVKTNYPEDATKLPMISIKDSAELPDSKTEGTNPVVVVITYPDGSKEEATVEVIIGKQADADKYEVEVQEQNIVQDAEVKAENSIKNKDTLPENTKFEFVDENGNINIPDTSNYGTITNNIKITYPDGTSEIVKAVIKVVQKDTIIAVEDANKEIDEGYTRIVLVEDETVKFKDGVSKIYDVKSDADIKYNDIVNLVEAMPKDGYKNLNWYELNVVANLFKQINGTDIITLTAMAEKTETTNTVKSNFQKLSIL